MSEKHYGRETKGKEINKNRRRRIKTCKRRRKRSIIEGLKNRRKPQNNEIKIGSLRKRHVSHSSTFCFFINEEQPRNLETKCTISFR